MSILTGTPTLGRDSDSKKTKIAESESGVTVEKTETWSQIRKSESKKQKYFDPGVRVEKN